MFSLDAYDESFHAFLHLLKEGLCDVNLFSYAVISGNNYLLNLSEKNYDFRRMPSKRTAPKSPEPQQK